jgi:hypothetical protein
MIFVRVVVVTVVYKKAVVDRHGRSHKEARAVCIWDASHCSQVRIGYHWQDPCGCC